MRIPDNRSKKSLMVFLAVLFLFALGQAGVMAADKGPDKIKLGCDNSLTGPLSVGGGWLQRGYDLAIKHINENGGVYVKEFDRKIPLAIAYSDNESDPKKVSARMEKLFSVDKIDFYLGGYTAFLLVQQMAIAEKNKVPMLLTTNGSMAEFEKGYRYNFTPFQTFKDQVTSFFNVLDSIPKDKRPSKIAHFQIQEEWGVTSGKIMREMAKEKGGYQVVTQEEYATGSNDFSSLIVKAKGDAAEVLYSCPFPPQGIRLIKQMKELKWAPKLTCLLRAADTGLWIKNLENDGNYVCHTGGWDFHLKLPGVERLNSEYKAAFNTMPEPPVGTAYACVQILANAIENAGVLDREKVRDALAKSKTMTVAGEVTFQPNGRSVSKYQQTMAQWQNGADQLVWPKDQASAELMYPAPPWEQR